MPTMPGDFADLVASTLLKMGPPKFSQIAQTRQRYEVLKQWWKKKNVDFQKGGRGIQRNLMTSTLGEAAHLDFMAEDTWQLGDYGTQAEIPWVRAQTKWSIHRILDLAMNTGETVVWKIIEMKRVGAMIDLAELLENAGWAAPADATDVTKPYGLPYWVVQNASEGFNGGAAFGTTVGGVDLSAHPTFKNYTDTYANVTFDDLIVSLIKAHFLCHFVSPLTLGQYRGEEGEQYRLYVNLTTAIELVKLLRNQNDNLGMNLAAMDGQPVFKNHPIITVPKLADSSNNPVYMVDHSTFRPVVLSGWFMHEETVRHPAQHVISGTFSDTIYNYTCIKRRANAVLYAA